MIDDHGAGRLVPGHRSRRVKLGLLTAVLGLFASAMAAGQFWQGRAAVGLGVVGKSGPVVGAEVVLRYLEVLPESGPDPVTTDERGEVAVYGLAEGSWQLDVSHPDYARYFAVIRLRAGKRPVITSGPVRHVEGLPLRLKLFKPEDRVTTPGRRQVEPRRPVEAPEPGVSTSEPPSAEVPTGAATATQAPQVGSELRMFGMRSCPDCRPGEWAFSAERPATGAQDDHAPGCDEGVVDRVEEAAKLLADFLEQAGGEIAGPLVSPTDGEVIELPDQEVRVRVAELVRPWSDTESSCQLVGVVLPAAARYTGYRYQARDTGGSGDCVGSQECEIGDCGWLGHPAVEQTAGGTVVYGLFENRSRSQRRVGKLTVYFTR